MINLACSVGGDLPPTYQRLFLELPRDEDRVLVADFIIDSYNQQNITPGTKSVSIHSLVYLSRYLGHKKSFKDMTSQDIIEDYLNSLKRPIQVDADG